MIDTGLGICNIYDEVRKLTDKHVIAVATHIHWDHIGGHKYFPDFYAHKAELDWLNGKFPLSIQTVRDMVIDRCDLPEGFDVSKYEIFQGTPIMVLHGGEIIDFRRQKNPSVTYRRAFARTPLLLGTRTELCVYGRL